MLSNFISVVSLRNVNKEASTLGGGINAFIERLQNILRMVTNSSQQMNGIAGEVSESLEKSNSSVMELTAVTEELATTMTEVGRNAGLINEILKVLNKAIKESESVSQVNNLTDDILTCNKQEFSHLCRWRDELQKFLTKQKKNTCSMRKNVIYYSQRTKVLADW